jgi:hypothetical protein
LRAAPTEWVADAVALNAGERSWMAESPRRS